MAIDPGLKGGLVLIESSQIIAAIAMPTLASGKVMDNETIAKWIHKQKPDRVYLEKVQAMFRASASSTFSFGRNLGAIQGILSALQIPYLQVHPKTWQKLCHDGVEKKFDPKHRSAVAAARLFPGFDFTMGDGRKIYHDGVVDAALIAYYGSQQGGASTASAPD